MLTRSTMAIVLAATVGGLTSLSSAANPAVDVSAALKVSVPAGGETPATFKTFDGKDGWVRKLSGESIPTPAFDKGKIFAGGGYASRSFWAIDALTGKTLWVKQTIDNGPTTPVVGMGQVAYNTESCHTESRDAESGELSWSQLTGGSLLTAPAIAGNALLIPHPTMERTAHADNMWKMRGNHLKTGQKAWDAPMTGDVLSAPVVAGNFTFFACTDGRVFCLKVGTGGNEWMEKVGATSAPVVIGDTVAVTVQEKGLRGTYEGIKRLNLADGSSKDDKLLAPTLVGSPVAASAVHSSWDYQGPKLAYANGKLFNAPGNTINAVDLKTGQVAWRAQVNGLGNAAQTLTPPALGAKQLYLGTAKGHLLVLKQDDGAVAASYDLGAPMLSQPILAAGNVYLGTADGRLVCLKLADKDASDWHAWGGNAGHNKVD